MGRSPLPVTRGLDPRVHRLRKTRGHFRKRMDGRVKPGHDDRGSGPAMTVGRASPAWRALVCWRATITTVSPLSRMARIAIIALMLFAAAPALAQPADTTAPTPAAPADTNTPPAAGNDAKTPPAATPPSATTEAPPASPP